MNTKKFRELISREIEETITSREQTCLQDYLRQHPQAEKLYDQQMETSQLFSDFSSVDPPADIKKNIMNSIDLNLYKGKKKKFLYKPHSSRRDSLFSPRMAVAFAGGLIVGIFLLLQVPLDKEKYFPDGRDFVGTIGMHIEGRFAPLAKLDINVSDISGFVQFTQYNEYIGCEINVQADDNYELLFEYDSANNYFYGVKPVNNIKISLENGNNYVRFANSTNVRFLLFFYRKSPLASEIELSIRQKGSEKYTHTIRLEPLRQKMDVE